MVQGSKMARSRKGMRKGMSLMELLTAIVLLGVLSSVGYQYYKTYYDVSLASKQVKGAILVEQGTQLTNLLTLYNMKNGKDLNETQGFAELVTQGMLTEVPRAIPEISSQGWYLEGNATDVSYTGVAAANQRGTASGELTFKYTINGTAGVGDKIDYCNVINSLASQGDTNLTATGAELNDTNTSAYINVGHIDFFCLDASGNNDGSIPEIRFIANHY